MNALLEIDQVTVRYGGLVAVNGVSFRLAGDEVLSLIGPNGAGKTTMFNAITGYVRPTSGQVRFEGRALTGLKPHEVARAGLARTFQKRSYFPQLSVCENVVTATLQAGDGSQRWAERRGNAERRAQEVLALVGLQRHRDELAEHLPYGEQRLLGIALALALDPKVLLLDEPCAGMNPVEVTQAIELIARLRERRLAIVVVEHQMKFVMGISDRVVVLDHGEKLAEGKPAQVRRDPRVVEAYLGRGAGEGATRA